MTTTISPVEERRKSARLATPPPQFGVSLVRSARGSLSAESVNLSEGGLCVRLREMLEVRSLVELRLTPEGAAAKARRPLRCTGRVTWVVQRLDLRDMPPFLFDTGLEFVNPPAPLRQWLLRSAGIEGRAKRPAASPKWLEQAVVRGRSYQPRLVRIPNRPDGWHLVVAVDGVPCFSEHYASERAAATGWGKFKRQRARRSK